MGESDVLSQVLAAVTPERLRSVAEALDAGQPEGTKGVVPVRALMEALAGGIDLDQGPEGWRAQMALTRTLKEVAAQTPGLRYFEGDS